MTDHFFSIALVFSLLAGGTAAIGSELIGSSHSKQAPAAVATVTLPMVVVTGRRAMPTVVVATESVAAEPQRLQ